MNPDVKVPVLELHRDAQSGVCVVTPLFPRDWQGDHTTELRRLLDLLMVHERLQNPVLWYYIPMMLAFSDHLDAICTVYDCMDELANFKFAPHDIVKREQELLDAADVVFTGGYSLFEHKRTMHRNVHPFPSSVDTAHFGKARGIRAAGESAGAPTAAPRFGFHGVIDERMDLDLLTEIVDAKPDWSWVIVGPVVKIDPALLPVPKRAANAQHHVSALNTAMLQEQTDHSALPAAEMPDALLGPAPTAGPTTPSIATLQPADAPMGQPGDNEEERLDEALQESMTTSDPVSIKIA